MLIYYLYFATIFMIYIFSFIFPMSREGYTLSQTRQQHKMKMFVFIAIVFWTLLVGLRSQSMGNDLGAYLPSFERISRCSWNKILNLNLYNYESGYVVFNKLIGTVWNNKQFFLFICAVCSIVPFGYFIYRYSSDPLFSLIIYMGLPIMLAPFSALRQGIALAITVMSFKYIKEKKVFKFLILVLLASLFHSSALVFLIAYPLFWIKFHPVSRVLSVAVIPVVYIFRNPIFAIVSKLFKENAVPDDNGAFTLFIIFTLIYVFCILFSNKENQEINGYLNLFWSVCLIQAMGGVYSIVLRVGYYFMPYLMLLLPEVFSNQISKFSKKYKTLLKFMVMSLFFGYSIYTLNKGGWAETNPYTFFWQ